MVRVSASLVRTDHWIQQWGQLLWDLWFPQLETVGEMKEKEMMGAGRKPEGGSPIVYIFGINIPFISDTHFQKCLCHVKYTSSLPKWSKLKIPSSYCI